MAGSRTGLGYPWASSHPRQRHCYVRTTAVDRLLDAPGTVEALLVELTGDGHAGAKRSQQLTELKRALIHLAVTPSPFHGLSLAEIIVLSAYASPRFARTSWKRELEQQPSSAELLRACHDWLSQRADQISPGRALGKPQWPLVGYGPRDRYAPTRFFVLGLAPLYTPHALDLQLTQLADQAGFAHEHYVACTPGTALAYLVSAAQPGGVLRWDPFALDRRLTCLGLGMLLVEPDGVSIYLPARYEPTLPMLVRDSQGHARGLERLLQLTARER